MKKPTKPLRFPTLPPLTQRSNLSQPSETQQPTSIKLGPDFVLGQTTGPIDLLETKSPEPRNPKLPKQKLEPIKFGPRRIGKHAKALARVKISNVAAIAALYPIDTPDTEAIKRAY